jgi:hypothetical protein
MSLRNCTGRSTEKIPVRLIMDRPPSRTSTEFCMIPPDLIGECQLVEEIRRLKLQLRDELLHGKERYERQVASTLYHIREALKTAQGQERGHLQAVYTDIEYYVKGWI